MKKSVLLVMLGLCFSIPALAEKEVGNGGNGLHNTPEAVAKRMHEPFDIGLLIEEIRDGLTGKVILPIQDVRAKNILAKIIALKNVVFFHGKVGWGDSILSEQPSVLKMKMTGACEENGEKRDASVRYHLDASGNPKVDELCVSAERLAVYPPESLEEQLKALMIHEFSHVAGFGEDDAIYIQNYVVNTLDQHCRLGLLIDNRGSGVDDVFEIDISRGTKAVVTHVRRFGGPSSSNLQLQDFNFADAPGSFQLEWSLTGGEMRFNSLNTDGKSQPCHVSWGSMSDLGSDELVSDQILASDLIFDAKLMRVNLVSIKPIGCQR